MRMSIVRMFNNGRSVEYIANHHDLHYSDIFNFLLIHDRLQGRISLLGNGKREPYHFDEMKYAEKPVYTISDLNADELEIVMKMNEKNYKPPKF